MSQWDGQSKGTLLGYQIFVVIIKKSVFRRLMDFWFLLRFTTSWLTQKWQSRCFIITDIDKISPR